MTRSCLAAVAAALVSAVVATPARAQRPVDRVSHIVVLYLENRSFNNLFGEFPGAEGVAGALAKGQATQRDLTGAAYARLPPAAGGRPFNVSDNPDEIRAIEIPALPNAPFAIDALARGVSTKTNTIDPVHRFYTHRAQINGGSNDRFAALSNAGGFVMGYYSRAAMEGSRLWRLARENTLLDRFFMGAFGGSFLNHQYLVCACAPVWPGAADKERAVLDSAGIPVEMPREGWRADNVVVAKGDGDFAVNTIQSVHLNGGGDHLLPGQKQPTIGDRLSDKGVDWAWYSGGFDLAAKPGRTRDETRVLNGGIRFQWHHQPFAYYERFNPGVPAGLAQRAKHLRDASRLGVDIASGQLPPVTFYKPSGLLNQHPGYAELEKGDAELGRIASMLAASPMKDSYLLVITYDENGGFWDHVAPPMGPEAGARADYFGPGSRVPAIIVSPLARKGHIDSTEFETGSILKLITERFNLEPLPSQRVKAVNSLAVALDPR